MAKQTAQVVQAPAVVPAKGPAKLAVIAAVKPGLKVRPNTARAAWYAVLQGYQGKPVAEFLAATTTTPPSLPKSGRPEKATGWLAWFTRNGIATISEK